MRLTINGEPRDVAEGSSLLDVLRQLGLTEGLVAIERNREVVPRREHQSVFVQPGDILEIVQFVGGG